MRTKLHKLQDIRPILKLLVALLKLLVPLQLKIPSYGPDDIIKDRVESYSYLTFDPIAASAVRGIQVNIESELRLKFSMFTTNLKYASVNFSAKRDGIEDSEVAQQTHGESDIVSSRCLHDVSLIKHCIIRI